MDVLLSKEDKKTIKFQVRVRWEDEATATMDREMAEIMVQSCLHSMYGMLGAADVEYEFLDFDSMNHHTLTLSCVKK